MDRGHAPLKRKDIYMHVNPISKMSKLTHEKLMHIYQKELKADNDVKC